MSPGRPRGDPDRIPGVATGFPDAGLGGRVQLLQGASRDTILASLGLILLSTRLGAMNRGVGFAAVLLANALVVWAALPVWRRKRERSAGM